MIWYDWKLLMYKEIIALNTKLKSSDTNRAFSIYQFDSLKW